MCQSSSVCPPFVARSLAAHAASLLATALVWTRRGPVVPAIPYKVVFVAYIIALLRVSQADDGAGGGTTAVRATAVAGIINSGMLAALRF